jgi:hypothetical protein
MKEDFDFLLTTNNETKSRSEIFLSTRFHPVFNNKLKQTNKHDTIQKQKQKQKTEFINISKKILESEK